MCSGSQWAVILFALLGPRNPIACRNTRALFSSGEFLEPPGCGRDSVSCVSDSLAYTGSDKIVECYEADIREALRSAVSGVLKRDGGLALDVSR
jgi:hypothetical protein